MGESKTSPKNKKKEKTRICSEPAPLWEKNTSQVWTASHALRSCQVVCHIRSLRSLLLFTPGKPQRASNMQKGQYMSGEATWAAHRGRRSSKRGPPAPGCSLAHTSGAHPNQLGHVSYTKTPPKKNRYLRSPNKINKSGDIHRCLFRTGHQSR